MFTRSPASQKAETMLTIAPVSQKGGSGKTTLALHPAVASAQTGRHATIIDLDPQASAAHWADRREAALPTVLATPASRLRPELDRALAAGVDLLYLDTAPHSDSAALKVARAADLALIPCRTAILDLEAITDTVQFLASTGTPALVVLNAFLPARPRCRSSRGRAPRAHPGRMPHPRRPPRGLCAGAADRPSRPRICPRQ